jgi:hypothetical protein
MEDPHDVEALVFLLLHAPTGDADREPVDSVAHAVRAAEDAFTVVRAPW